MKISSDWPKAGTHLIMLFLAWLAFSIMVGLFGAFQAMEEAGNNIASTAILGAMKTAGLLVLTGSLLVGTPIYLLIRRIGAH